MVVCFLLSALHGGDILVIEAVRGTASGIDDIAFVELEANLSVDGLLGFGNEGLDGFPFRRKPKAVLDALGVSRNKSIANVLSFTIDGEGFEVLMGRQ